MRYTSAFMRLLLAITTLGLVWMCAGCAEQDESRIIRLMVWPLAAADAVYDRIEKSFEDAYEGYDLRVEKVPIRGYEEKLIVMMSAKDAPEVAILPQFRYEEYLRQKALADLTKLFDYPNSTDKSGLSTLPVDEVDALRTKGRIRAIPTGLKGVIWVVPRTADQREMAFRLLRIIAEETFTLFKDMPKPRLSLF